MDATRFVCYAATQHTVIVGVREFEIGGALREGKEELLRQLVPSQWGPVHLFDICLTFGHVHTALAMAWRGVEGCRLEAYHLRRTWSERPLYADEAWGAWVHACRACKCNDGWQTCDECCFGFQTEQGIWMNDWYVSLKNAAEAACETAEQPLVRAVLETFSQSGPTLPFAVSAEAMAHLLDIAFLTGNKEAARHCMEQSKLRPLRRWSSYDLLDCRVLPDRWFELSENSLFLLGSLGIEVHNPAVLLAALLAGVELQDLKLSSPYIADSRHWGLPLHEALALSSAPWNDFAELLQPPESPWALGDKKDFRECFIEIDEDGDHNAISLSKQKIQKAQMIGLPLHNFDVFCCCWDSGMPLRLSLLDVAILLGQSDCALLCAAVGCKLLRNVCWEECLDVDPARRLATIAAAHEMLAMSWKSQVFAKGIAVYQLMKKNSGGKFFPSQLVDVVIAFSLDMPEIVDELDLWVEAHAWCQSAGWWGALSSSGPQELPPSEEISIYGEEGTGEKEKADLPPTRPVEPSPEPVDEKAMDDLMVAMRESRNEVPPLNNNDGVCLFRLKSFANAKHVVNLLFDPHGPLKALHDRVKEAGCSLSVTD